jgi:hypothetical protein
VWFSIKLVNQESGEIFDHMARVLAFKGKDRFRALAYERAWDEARSVVNAWPRSKFGRWLQHRCE